VSDPVAAELYSAINRLLALTLLMSDRHPESEIVWTRMRCLANTIRTLTELRDAGAGGLRELPAIVGGRR